MSLRRKGMHLLADNIAQFFYAGEVIGVVWSSCPPQGEKDWSLLELFYASTNHSFFRQSLTLPEFPFAKLCSVAWTGDGLYVVAVFWANYERWGGQIIRGPHTRLLLALFRLTDQTLLSYIDVGDHDLASYPTYFPYTGEHPVPDVTTTYAAHHASWRIACAADGALMMFQIKEDKLDPIWRQDDVWISHLTFMADGNLAYLVYEKPAKTVCLNPEQRTELISKIVCFNPETRTELCSVSFCSAYGVVTHLTPTATTDHAQTSSVTIAFHRALPGCQPHGGSHVCLCIDLVPRHTYMPQPKHAVTCATAEIPARPSSHRRNTPRLTSLSFTSQYVMIGTGYGHVHIADQRRHRMYTLSRDHQIEDSASAQLQHGYPSQRCNMSAFDTNLCPACIQMATSSNSAMPICSRLDLNAEAHGVMCWSD